MDIKGRTLDYREDDEHILRRLGAAVVLLWDDLPQEGRRRILEQALCVTDRHQTVQLKEQIEGFISSHKLESRS